MDSGIRRWTNKGVVRRGRTWIPSRCTSGMAGPRNTNRYVPGGRPESLYKPCPSVTVLTGRDNAGEVAMTANPCIATVCEGRKTAGAIAGMGALSRRNPLSVIPVTRPITSPSSAFGCTGGGDCRPQPTTNATIASRVST